MQTFKAVLIIALILVSAFAAYTVYLYSNKDNDVTVVTEQDQALSLVIVYVGHDSTTKVAASTTATVSSNTITSIVTTARTSSTSTTSQTYPTTFEVDIGTVNEFTPKMFYQIVWKVNSYPFNNHQANMALITDNPNLPVTPETILTSPVQLDNTGYASAVITYTPSSAPGIDGYRLVLTTPNGELIAAKHITLRSFNVKYIAGSGDNQVEVPDYFWPKNKGAITFELPSWAQPWLRSTVETWWSEATLGKYVQLKFTTEGVDATGSEDVTFDRKSLGSMGLTNGVACAVTEMHVTSTGTLISVKITENSAATSWLGTYFRPACNVDEQRIFAHEIGHALGLMHSTGPDVQTKADLLYYAVQPSMCLSNLDAYALNLKFSSINSVTSFNPYGQIELPLSTSYECLHYF